MATIVRYGYSCEKWLQSGDMVTVISHGYIHETCYSHEAWLGMRHGYSHQWLTDRLTPDHPSVRQAVHLTESPFEMFLIIY